MNEGYSVIPSKKKAAKPQVAKRVADRKAFVAGKTAEKGITPAQARQRFYVQTRMSELKAAGKPVDAAKRKELQKKFQSGGVTRKGFAAPKKSTGGTTGTGSTPVVKKFVKPQPARAGYSAANISATAKGANANHSQRSAPQVIRSKDTELRGRPKPAYKNK